LPERKEAREKERKKRDKWGSQIKEKADKLRFEDRGSISQSNFNRKPVRKLGSTNCDTLRYKKQEKGH
jgi:hypothetical protein